MASSVDIANIALTMLSASRITSLTDNSENARRINAIYDHERDALLAEHNWNFAREQAQLSLLSDTPTLGNWDYIYQLPSDCLRIIRMEYDYNFSRYGNKLYTNATEAKIDYIKRITDDGAFSSLFVKAFACRLALELSYGITESSTQTEAMSRRYKAALDEAKWSDAQEGIGTEIITGSFLDYRY